MRSLQIIPIVALASSLMLGACKKDQDANTTNPANPAASGPSTMKIRMTDGPGNYQGMIMQITKVEAFIENRENGDDGWFVLNGSAQSVSVLELTNGNEEIIASDNAPEKGRYSKLRLTFGTENHLQLIGGDENDWLNLGFSQQSSSQVIIDIQDEDVNGNDGDHSILLDFDVASSVHFIGDSYFIDPQVDEIDDEMTGARGRIVGALHAAIMFEGNSESQDDDASTFIDPNGNFLVRGMLDGTYDLMIEGEDADSHQIRQIHLDNVIIVKGEIKNMGEINFD